MNIVKAAKSMRRIIYRTPIGFNHTDGCERSHLLYMCNTIMKKKVVGEKAHRWVGWIQGVCTSVGITSLSQCKRVNKRA